MAATRKTSSRSAAERARVTHDWLRACEELHRALITPMGLPPKQWAAKVALARQVDDLHAEMVHAWGLPEARAVAEAPATGG